MTARVTPTGYQLRVQVTGFRGGAYTAYCAVCAIKAGGPSAALKSPRDSSRVAHSWSLTLRLATMRNDKPQPYTPGLSYQLQPRVAQVGVPGGGARGSAVWSNTSPCWTDREVVPAADQDFPKGPCVHHGCWAHTKWIGNEKLASWKVATSRDRRLCNVLG
jgi:hypothetical protein